jgi:serine O-acetyltransferase
VVLHPVPAYSTVAGVPAKLIGQDKKAKPALEMNQYFTCE